jgi:uncharacterized RDD family membrane protein YckC
VLTVRVTRRAAIVPAAGSPETDPAGLVIGDAVELDLPIARVSSRGLARLIDLIAQIGVLLLVGTVLSAIAAASGSADQAIFGVIVVVVEVTAFIGYPVLLETLTRGRTLGKFALGLRVVRDDGGAIRFRQALTRALIGFAAEWPGLLPPLTWFASLACMQTDPRSKRLGDIGAGTIVIHERTPIVWGWIPVMPAHLAGWAANLDLGGVSDELALEMRQYLIRYRFLTAAARLSIGNDLAAELGGVIKPLPPPGINGRDFLIAVLAERHRRSVARLVTARTATATVWPELMHATGQGAWLPPRPAPSAAGIPATAIPAQPGPVPLRPPAPLG